MPDDTTRAPHRHGAPHDWNAAFAALPLERPDSDAWDAIASRLPKRKAANWPVRIALAAALALAVVVPLRMLAPPRDVPADTNAPTTLLLDGAGTVRWFRRPERIIARLSPAELLAAMDETLGPQ